MTPKEKAEELYSKYIKALEIRDLQIIANPFVKKCALIAVEEILKSNPTKINCDSSEFNYGYYQEVKKEIELLYGK